MSPFRALVLSSVAIGVCGVIARADASPAVLFDNLSSPQGGNLSVASFSQSLGDGPLGAEFMTLNSDVVVSVGLDLAASDNANTGAQFWSPSTATPATPRYLEPQSQR